MGKIHSSRTVAASCKAWLLVTSSHTPRIFFWMVHREERRRLSIGEINDFKPPVTRKLNNFTEHDRGSGTG